MESVELKVKTILPTVENVLKRLNYNPKITRLDKNILDQIKKILNDVKRLIHPAGLFLDVNLNEVGNDYVILENKKISSKRLSDVLKKSRIATIIIATIGNEISIETEKKLKEESFTEAVIIDAIGSESVEAFVNYIEEIIARRKRLYGLRPTMRFSPGYGDLPLRYQADLLNFTGADRIGVSINKESFVLIPEKSITAIIGWEK